MPAIDIDHRAFRKTFRSILIEIVETNGNPCLSRSHALNHSMVDRRPGVDNLLLGTNAEVLFEALPVHDCSVIFDLNQFAGHSDVDFSGVGIIGIIDQLPEELDTL